MLTTRFTELVGCAAPIQQAGMGSHANPRLAAAVAQAGALGMVSVYGHYGGPPEHIAEMLDRARVHTTGTLGANFIVGSDPLDHECVAAAARRVRVVDFFWGTPAASLVQVVHAEGALACWQIGSREEAIAATDAGCDFVIAQGIEAGGHVRGRFGLLALLDQVLSAVDVPVVAAGGIGSGRAMAAALAAGADGVRVGTRFLAVEEAEAHPDYLKALIAAEAKDTIYTEAFSVGWPDAPHRVLRSSLAEAEAFKGEFIGTVADTWNGEPYDVRPFQCHAVHQSAVGHIAAMSMWAGESVGNVTRPQTAAEIVEELTTAAEALLRHWN